MYPNEIQFIRQEIRKQAQLTSPDKKARILFKRQDGMYQGEFIDGSKQIRLQPIDNTKWEEGQTVTIVDTGSAWQIRGIAGASAGTE